MSAMDRPLISISCAVLGLGLLSLWGCASAPRVHAEGRGVASEGGDSGDLEIAGVTYARVFDAARETLMDYRFAINRVDAARGLLTTHPKRTAGLASPWDREQSSLRQEWEDLVNQQQREVRVNFVDIGDRAGADDAVRLRVRVLVTRAHRPHWRVEPESVRLSTHARSRDVLGSFEPGSFDEQIGHDAALAERLARSIARRLAAAE